MLDHVRKVLEKKEQPKELRALLSRCLELVKMSRETMSNSYDIWDSCDRVYRGERKLDAKDRQAMKRKEPAKSVVPMTYSQTQTFVSFLHVLFAQRDYIYELGGSGAEDEKPAQLGQAVIERDLEHNAFRGVLLPQFAANVARFSLGIFKSGWTRKTCPKVVQVPDPNWQPDPMMPNATQPPMVTQVQDVTEYLGNEIKVVSPYRWFPDVRLPISRYREGEFCADEFEQSIGELRSWENIGLVAGLDHVPQADQKLIENRRTVVVTKEYVMRQAQGDSRYVLITEVQIRLNPARTEIDAGVVLDEHIDNEVIYLIWIANDGRIIRLEDSGYDHNQFTYDAAQFFNDQERIINFSLAELLGPMQDTLDFLFNSRITNVRKVIQNQLVVDPRVIDTDDLAERRPVIRLKSTAQAGLSLNHYIQQLQVTDITAGHLADMQTVQGFAQESTGITENLLGQYASGRRSAREASSVNANAASRLAVVAQGLWDSAILPLGKKLLSNIRQGLDEDQLIRVVGLTKVMEDPQSVQAFLPVNRTLLYGTYDFLVFNATLPSQRMADAQVLQELLVAGASNPSMWFVLGLDPKLVAYKLLQLRNIHNVEQFRLTPQRAQELAMLGGAAPVQGGPPAA